MKQKTIKSKLALALATTIVVSEAALVVSANSVSAQQTESIKVATAQTTGSQITTNKGGSNKKAGSQTLPIASVVTTGSQVQTGTTTITQIKQDVANGITGQSVRFEGVVTRKTSTSMYIQTDEAGILIYGKRTGTAQNAAIGDKVLVEGKTSLYNGSPQITNASLELISTGNQVNPVELTIAEYKADMEKYQGRLIKIKDITLGEVNTSGSTTLTDATGSINVYKIAHGVEEGAIAYDVIAIGSKIGSTAQLTVLDKSDVIPHDGVGTLTSEKIQINVGETFTLPKVKVFENGVGQVKDVTWNQDELNAVNTNKMGVYTVTGICNDRTLTVTIYVSTDQFIPISQIQGAGHTSPLLGLTVNETRGVVTFVNGTYGFYIQSLEADMDADDATSEGLYISSSAANVGKVAVGDIVTIKGTVQENALNSTQLSVTQLYATSVKVESSGNTLPEPVVIGEGGRIPPNQIIDNDGFSVFDPEQDSIDFYESLEGMRIQINEAQVVGPKDKGAVPVVPNKGKYSLDLISPQGGVVITEDTLHPEILTLAESSQTNLPEVESGDVFIDEVTGVMTYQYGIYKMLVDGSNYQVEASTYDKNPQTTLKETEHNLRVASFNVKNLAGTDSQAKYDGIGEVIAHNLLFPDIIGLEEVQDNDGTVDSGDVSADVVYTRIIEAIKAQPGSAGIEYDYVQIDPQNNVDGGSTGANIRIGILYRKDRVQLADGQAGDATTATKVLAGDNGKAKLSLNPGRIEPTSTAFDGTRKSLAVEFTFNGEQVFIIGNHFNSKREDDAAYGSQQPAQLNSETKRIKQAKIVNQFIQEILAVNPQSKIVVFGDMNDHHYSNPLKALEGNELYNMHYKLPENERYTYVYQGRSQVLDNFLINKELEECTEIEIIHVNTMHSEDTQLSDHDPLLISIDMIRANEILKPSESPSVPEESPSVPEESPSVPEEMPESPEHEDNGNTDDSNQIGDKDDNSDDDSDDGLSDNLSTDNKQEDYIKVECSASFIASQLQDKAIKQVTYEAKQDEKYMERFVVNLEREAVNKLITNKKDLVIQLETAEILVPYQLMQADKNIEVLVNKLEATNDTIVNALPSEREWLAGYEIAVKINSEACKALDKKVRVTFALPNTVEKSKLAAYLIKDGEYKYMIGTVKENTVTVALSESGQIVLTQSTKTFADIKKHWAKEQIEALAAKHLVVGVDEENFEPNLEIKTSDFAAVLTRLTEKETEVESTEQLLSRGQMAVMLRNALAINEVLDTNQVLATFKDIDKCTEEEKQALAYLYSEGIIVGQTSAKMAPNEILTRAEMAMVVSRLFDSKE